MTVQMQWALLRDVRKANLVCSLRFINAASSESRPNEGGIRIRKAFLVILFRLGLFFTHTCARVALPALRKCLVVVDSIPASPSANHRSEIASLSAWFTQVLIDREVSLARNAWRLSS